MNDKYSHIFFVNKKRMILDLIISIVFFVLTILSIVFAIVFITDDTKLFFVIFFPIIGSLSSFVVIILMLGDFLPRKRKNDFIKRLFEYEEESFEGTIQSLKNIVTLKDVGECLQIIISNEIITMERYYDLEVMDIKLKEGEKIKITSHDLFISELEIYDNKIS